MNDNKPGARAALKAFCAGVACCLVGFGAFRLTMVGGAAVEEWRPLLGLSLLGGVVFATGGAIAGSVAGSVLGAIAGVFLGGAASVALPEWKVAYLVEEVAAPGPPFPTFKAPGLDGKPIELADYKGKILLVDFWATWCPPCVEELPYVQATYDKFHANGFDVLGVSLDNSREDLESFVKRRKLPWRQVFYDEQGQPGGRNPLAQSLRVNAIPATFLLDREGRLVATALRGTELEREVQRLVNQLESDPNKPGVRQRVEQLLLTPYISMAAGALLLAVLGAVFQRLVTPAAKPS
jgi:peroxiredoxin